MSFFIYSSWVRLTQHETHFVKNWPIPKSSNAVSGYLLFAQKMIVSEAPKSQRVPPINVPLPIHQGHFSRLFFFFIKDVRCIKFGVVQKMPPKTFLTFCGGGAVCQSDVAMMCVNKNTCILKQYIHWFKGSTGCH